jgi:transcriptional regulator with GAF, ATPase, and Fis domain
VPRELYESEFFGHARGSFTNALRDRAGRFELANGGTLFLDEVGEIPLELQAKLLRVLPEGDLERVGEERTRKVDVRLIAATNRDLRAEAESRRFRQDLFYRLSVFPVELPPLRSRVEDIPLLSEHFLSLSSRRLGRPKPRLTPADVRQLQRYHWPGNVRELQHVIERAVITAEGSCLAIDLPTTAPPAMSPTAPVPADGRVLTDAEMRRRGEDNLRAALRQTGGKVSGAGGAAELLEINPSTLASRMKSLGLPVNRPST